MSQTLSRTYPGQLIRDSDYYTVVELVSARIFSVRISSQENVVGVGVGVQSALPWKRSTRLLFIQTVPVIPILVLEVTQPSY